MTDAFAPLSLAEAVALFTPAPFRWWISGGHALELHVAVVAGARRPRYRRPPTLRRPHRTVPR